IQVVAARDAEAFVAVGKRMRFAAAPEAAPPVPCDQAVAQPDDLHAQAAAAEDLARKALGLGQDAVANPPALPARVDGKQAEPGSAAIAFQVAAAQQGAAGLLGQQDALPFAEHGQDAFTVGPLAIEEVGLGGPAGPAGLAAVGGLREGDDGVRVGRRGPAEMQFGGRGGGQAGTIVPTQASSSRARPSALTSRSTSASSL